MFNAILSLMKRADSGNEAIVQQHGLSRNSQIVRTNAGNVGIKIRRNEILS